MSDINGKSVTYAKLHNGIFIPKVGNLKDTLEAVDSGTGKAVKMTIQEPWVIAEFKDSVGKPVVTAIPTTSFSHLVLAKD